MRPSPRTPSFPSKRPAIATPAIQQSRGLFCTRRFAAIRTPGRCRASSKHSGPVPHILESAFPKKTLLFLVALGSFVYFFVDVSALTSLDGFYEDAERRMQYVVQVFPNFDELDHFMDVHLRDMYADTMFQDSSNWEVHNEAFLHALEAWEMSEDQSQSLGAPVTHGCCRQSNVPCEDFYALGRGPGPGPKPWNMWSIYDGHAGSWTAEYLQQHLQPRLWATLYSLNGPVTTADINQTIKRVFVAADDSLMFRARNAANWLPVGNAQAVWDVQPALSGSCALVAAFDQNTDVLRVACTGDSRAVLGRWDRDALKYVARPLSVDQTGFNEAEVARINAEHPDETGLIDPQSGRLMGLAVTRAFGDHRWKWDNEFIKQVQYRFWGSPPRPVPEGQTRSPPYLTAEPEVVETDVVRVAPGAGDASARSDFMIMASDGLWDRISSEHAVECVQRWLEARDRGNGLVSADPRRKREHMGDRAYYDPGFKVDPATGLEASWQATPEYFAIEDDNAAVCLLRNAMGGTRRAIWQMLNVIPPPRCREVIDDTTIMVVFFDRTEGSRPQEGKPKPAAKRKWWKPW